jgi:hypothetical protein
MPYLCLVPRKMIVKTTTGCQWEMNIKKVSGNVVLEDGWLDFAFAHNLKIGILSHCFPSKKRVQGGRIPLLMLPRCWRCLQAAAP